MENEKLQELIKKMSRGEIENYCKKKNWRLPTFEEAMKIYKKTDHPDFWIEGYEDSLDEETNIVEKRPLYFDKGEKFTLNPNFKMNVIVFEKKERCICEVCKKEIK